MAFISQLRIAVVCANNINRSMEAHNALAAKGFCVKSFGTSSIVRLPGPNADSLNLFQFGTTYTEMYQQLLDYGDNIYLTSGLLGLLLKNNTIKPAPERFQDNKDKFDFVFTCDKFVFERVVAELNNRVPEERSPVHVINITIEDNQAEAVIGAKMICDLCMILSECENINENIGCILYNFEHKIEKTILHWIGYN